MLDALYEPENLRQANVNAVKTLKSQGVPASRMHKAGFTISELVQAFNDDLEVLRVECQILPREMRDAGCKAHDMKRAGYSAKECKGVFNVREIIGAYGNQVLEENLFELSELFRADVKMETLQAIKIPGLFGIGKVQKWSDQALEIAFSLSKREREQAEVAMSINTARGIV